MQTGTKQSNSTLRLGSRASKLALWQTEFTKELLQKFYPEMSFEIETITSRGDKILDTPLPLIGGKGIFTDELRSCLWSVTIDLAVHSLKDLPTECSPGLTIGAIPKRAPAFDVLVSRKGYTLEKLPVGARVGSTSFRRTSQVLYKRPDLRMESIRGNVETRVRKALDREGIYDAIILAFAGLERLGLEDVISEVLSFEQMLPAPGQGALGIQCRDEESMASILATINDLETQLATTAERAFLTGLGGGCSLPIAAFARFENDALFLRGRVIAQDGSSIIEVDKRQSVQLVDDAYKIGIELAQKAIGLGANELLKVET